MRWLSVNVSTERRAENWSLAEFQSLRHSEERRVEGMNGGKNGGRKRGWNVERNGGKNVM